MRCVAGPLEKRPPRRCGSCLLAGAQVEGTCSGQYGFVICVTHLNEIGKGFIREGTGHATFGVKYSCVVFRPFKGEVVDCVVTSVNKVSHAERVTLFCDAVG